MGTPALTCALPCAGALPASPSSLPLAALPLGARLRRRPQELQQQRVAALVVVIIHEPEPIMKSIPIHVSKIDAARRQLRTAIRLWFYDHDPVSAHTLVSAAREIIQVILKKRNPSAGAAFDLLAIVKKEYRNEISTALKQHANFFKHASRDPDETIEFHPGLSELFILIAVQTLSACGELLREEERAFLVWMQLHSPELLNPEGQKLLNDSIPVKILDELRRLPKHEFFENWLQARALQTQQRRGL